MFLTVLIVLVVLFLTYWYLKQKYFTLRGPLPGLAPEFFFGNMRQTGMLTENKSIANVHLELKRQFGDIYRFWMGGAQFVSVCNADDVQHIFQHRHIYDQGDVHVEKFSLLFHDALICNKGRRRGYPFLKRLTRSRVGAKYRRHASLTLPLFRRGKIMKNFDVIVDCTDRFLLDHWRSSNAMDIHTDIVQQSQRLFLAVFGYIAFDYDLEAPAGNVLTVALQDFIQIFVKTLYMPKFMGKIYLELSSRYHRALANIRKYLDAIMTQEQTEKQVDDNDRKRTSLIASLVHSMQKDEHAEAMKSEEEKQGLSRDEIVDEMLLFLVAGFETTSTALAWCIHLLSKNPRVQSKLKAELMDISFSVDRLDEMVYLDAAIREVLRFAPPSNGTVRTLTADDRLPTTGALLHKGEQVTIPFYNLARDTRYWNIDPEQFFPERFLENGLDRHHHPFALIPFGGGHRQCIGQDLARFELKVIVARLMQSVTFGDGGTDVNSGGHEQQFTILPKRTGVTISFD